ncbi:sialate O-acetylesterase [Dyadobacter sp. NIV53]|uniref:sialate O-acetylesterase n=1 Tax=Dyadobacter sp. NIV53 TaxID=2861765 RepID=UPI001C87B497|nr:sialate O-acetylesterase [Dyadobacter sp. NIV53]
MLPGGTISSETWQTLSVSATGMFYLLLSRGIGWYSLEINYNGIFMDRVKFGIGDVYIVAGQSNAQGYGENGNWILPAPANYPEWIVTGTQDGNCTNLLPADSYNTMNQISGFSKLAPTGNNSWCYAALGKKLSEAAGGMPIAFFNTASGGSTIKQWYQGSQNQPAPNAYTSGAQFCDVPGYTGPYIGQPYTPLRTALNYYASLYGVRAVLWHQGEADADAKISDAVYKIATSSEYQTKLEAVIAKSRADFGNTNLAWIISIASIINYKAPLDLVRNGQIASVNATLKRFTGPDTDYFNGIPSQAYRKDGTHFENSATYHFGLDSLAGKWFSTIGNNGYRILAGFVPNVTYTYNSLAETRTLTAPAGYAEYRWGTNINNPISGANTRYFYPTSAQGIKCFIKDSNGNWHMSTEITVMATPGTRISAEEKMAEDFGTDLTLYPNPVDKDMTIEFTVQNANSQVLLEIVDINGRVIKTIVENPHSKGRWKYQVNNFSETSGVIYFCRLKIDELSLVKKIITVRN